MPPTPVAMWNTLMPESLKRCRSAAVNDWGSRSQGREPMLNGLSMSITVARPTSSIARAE
jgi:hypothetical protein